MREGLLIKGPDGTLWLRPDNGCYGCDVQGPGCLAHAQEWISDPIGLTDELA